MDVGATGATIPGFYLAAESVAATSRRVIPGDYIFTTGSAIF